MNITFDDRGLASTDVANNQHLEQVQDGKLEKAMMDRYHNLRVPGGKQDV